jgi:hypothetical protein
VAASAAGQLVTLVDSTTSHKARVAGDGTLSVSERPATATQWFVTVATIVPKAPEAPVFIPPAGKTKLAISTLVFTDSDPVTSDFAELVIYGNSNCTGELTNLEQVALTAGSTVPISFPEPLLIAPGGSNWCLTLRSSSGVLLRLTASGYYY